MLSIFNNNNQYSEKLKSMADKDFYNEIVAHSVSVVYEKINTQVDRYNERNEGVIEFNLFIPEFLNDFIKDVTGKDLAKETNSIIINDSYVSQVATHHLLELMIDNKKETNGYTQIAIAALINLHSYNGFDSERIVTEAYKNNYITSEKRLESIKSCEPPIESDMKIKKLEEALEKVFTAKANFINMSADFMMEFGLLRNFIESGQSSIQSKLINILENPQGFTIMEIPLTNKDRHEIIFDNDHILIRNNIYGEEEDSNYQLMALDGTKEFQVAGEKYEASHEGLKTLEMFNLDNKLFKIRGNTDYLHEDTPSPEQETRIKLKM